MERIGLKLVNYDEIFSVPVYMQVSSKTNVDNPSVIIDKLNKAYAELVKFKKVTGE